MHSLTFRTPIRIVHTFALYLVICICWRLHFEWVVMCEKHSDFSGASIVYPHIRSRETEMMRNTFITIR